MSDNDVTSGDPWGLSHTETESPPPPPPPPAPVSPQDELPEDLADLSTIADQDSADEREPPTLPDMELAVPADSPEQSDKELADLGSDLDLGDFGNFSDLDQDSDLGPLAESALAESVEADTEISAEIVEGALADLSISEDLPGTTGLPDTGDLPGFEDLGLGSIDGPNDSDEQARPATRPMNPLLAASGLFGGSPSLPPLKESAPSVETTAEPAYEAATEDSEDAEDAPSFDGAISSIEFDDPTSDFESIELTDGDLPDFDVPAVDVDEPADIDAELAQTLTALGDQPAAAISFSSDSVFGAGDQDVDSDESSDDRADFYPEFMSHPAPTDQAREGHIASIADVPDEADEDEVHRDQAETEEDEVFAATFGDTDFSSAGAPPAIYQELEHLGDDASDADGSRPGTPGDSVEQFGVVFGGSNETADDPFGAVFGSGDDAIAAVAAAAASIETKPSTILDHADAPTVDDLPDFMMDDEPAADPEVADPTPHLTQDAPEAIAADGSHEAPMDAEAGEVEEDFAEAGEEFSEEFTKDEAEHAETGESARQDSESPQGQAAESSGVATEDIAIEPQPPMPLVDTPTLDSDPFAAAMDDLKVDAAELGVGEAASVHPPILGTIATGVIAKKPIPEDWGTRSDDAYEGWVQDDDGVETWRMIITNLPTVAGYEIDEFLGLAVADSLVGSHDVHAVASGRRAAIDALTEDGVLRGAHAIVAVTHAVQPIEHQMLVTVSGTAVTLKPTAVALAD